MRCGGRVADEQTLRGAREAQLLGDRDVVTISVKFGGLRDPVGDRYAAPRMALLDCER